MQHLPDRPEHAVQNQGKPAGSSSERTRKGEKYIFRFGTISTGNLYQGDGSPTLLDARTVQIALVPYDSYPETNVMLFATADNGIVAVDDGGTWGGTGGTGLPFP